MDNFPSATLHYDLNSTIYEPLLVIFSIREGLGYFDALPFLFLVPLTFVCLVVKYLHMYAFLHLALGKMTLNNVPNIEQLVIIL